MSQLPLVEKILYELNEKLTVNRFAPVHRELGVYFTYSRGYFPNAIVSGGNGQPFTIINIKGNKGTFGMGSWDWSQVGGKVTTTASGYSASPEGATLKSIIDGFETILKNKGLLGKILRDLSPTEFMQFMANKNAVDLTLLYKMYPELVTAEQENKRASNGFEITQISDKDGKIIEDIIDSAAKALKAAGFDKLMYGKVISTTDLGRALADYSKSTDTMRMSNKAKKSADGIRFFVHELGHRLWYKFMTPAQQKIVNDKFREVYFEDKTVTATKGEIYKLHILKHGEVNAEIVGIDAGSIFGGQTKYKLKVSIDGRDEYYSLTPKQLSKYKRANDDSIWKVTPYASTSNTEFFAEIFSFAILEPTKYKEILNFIQQFRP